MDPLGSSRFAVQPGQRSEIRNPKSEIRNPKPETNAKGGKEDESKTRRTSRCLEPLAFGFRVCFGLRISGFGFQALRPPSPQMAGLSATSTGWQNGLSLASDLSAEARGDRGQI
jgi:hypothetical protein